MNLDKRCSMSSTFINYNVYHSDVVIRIAMNGFMNRINLSENALICTIVNSTYFTYCDHQKQWDKFLNVMYL